jgi:CRISPR/Cas system-associated endonuclease/helicase Cas3
MLWRASIVITTAVQFFETLASNMPADLRKLHRLPGSAVFIDEAHAALPAHLWSQAWLWLNELSEQWGCHFVFASGSLSRFWELSDFHPRGTPQEATPPKLPELVAESLRAHALDRETARVIYRTKPEAVGLSELIQWVSQHKGPRLLVLNTVQSAAVVAREMSRHLGCGSVEHLSTALAPDDRQITLNRVKQRLETSPDFNWTLVATSCVEAGVDFSFHVGLRERASLMSLIQLGGRVNRGHEREEAEVWDFQIKPDNLMRLHPHFKTAARVLGELFDERKIAPEYCKEALKREIRWNNTLNDELLKAESTKDARNADFPKVAELFKVIDANTVTVVVAPHLQEQLLQGKWCGREEIQMHSVQIWGWRVQELGLREFSRFPGLYGWPYDYDSFLGYMSGLLPVIEFASGKPTVI